jgi:L-lactate dehydrogenase complex protein LldG
MGRKEIFARVKSALSDVTTTDSPTAFAEDASTNWEYGRPTAVTDAVELFTERIIDYRATVEKAEHASEIPVLVARFLAEAQATSCAIPPDIDRAWFANAEAAGIKIHPDNPPLSKEELDKISAVVTAACVGMAETGTIALDHRPDQGRRILSLLPDTHICIIRTDQIVTDVPEGLARLQSSLREGLPLTWISGPSATSDIELSRVEGVHGPRNLFVIIVP